MKGHTLIDLGFTLVSCIESLNTYLNCITVNTIECCKIRDAVFFFFLNKSQTNSIANNYTAPFDKTDTMRQPVLL